MPVVKYPTGSQPKIILSKAYGDITPLVLNEVLACCTTFSLEKISQLKVWINMRDELVQ